jgi:ubiquinone/menaquinone biosynthesis C-methylase UbiE
MTSGNENSAVERERIVAEYEDRARRMPADFYSLIKPANLFIHQSHERALAKLLAATGRTPLAGKSVLETGCGEGNWLKVWELLGVERENLAGIELGEDRVALARQKSPAADIRVGDATKLPWPDQTFDFVFHRMMFSSILDPQVRQTAAQEQLRVVKPQGLIVWLDFIYNNPHNPSVRRMSRSELRRLYPGCRQQVWLVTLAPPLVRRLVGWSWTLCEALQSLRVLNTYYLAAIWPNDKSCA